jgi:ATP-dependent RNA helicase SUPV3L1/SUV3
MWMTRLAIRVIWRNSRNMEITTSQARVVAVLGPTNTGKTYLAMDRMLAHATGMIGFPLRLLARENYDRAVKIKGRNAVALITGEEKILPLGANYFICTVESMPVDRRVDFLAVDEIQMCADPDRGHVFTDRLLHARGEHETMFLGAETMRPLIRQLVDDVEFVSRPRYSVLTHVGAKKTTRLPKRSAIVAFSAADVYAIAELVRRQRGGAAVVMGALSPRTRNAQVAMYQSGEVEYIVATDAIGMGLNMDVDHVAFAATHKFDGRMRRALEPSELAQIAGRAGRYMNDGTFGTTSDATAISEENIARIENHEFDPLRKISWRNSKPRFTSIDDLLKSLAVPPNLMGLGRAREADDEMILRQLAKDPDVADMANHYEAVKLLWDVCQVPDFGNVMSDGHSRLLAQIYTHLMTPPKKLPATWLDKQVLRLDRTDGDIEHLTGRIAGIRTWTYVAFRSDWIDDPLHWRERTRAIEDRLSDALHDCLTQRFVDRRTAHLMQRMNENPDLLGAVKADGQVVVEGHFVGALMGFRFLSDAQPGNAEQAVAAKAIDQAAAKALRQEIASRVRQLETATDDAFALEREDAQPTMGVLWRGETVGRLIKGGHILRPKVQVDAGDLVDAPARERIERRLESWITARISNLLAPLLRLQDADLSGPARGLAFQVGESLGSLSRRQALREIDALSRPERQALRRAGVRIGRDNVYVETLLKPHAVDMRGLLWALYHDTSVTLPAAGRVSIAKVKNLSDVFYQAIGYRIMGARVIRMDMVERIASLAWELAKKPPFVITPDLLSLAGCTTDQMTEILKQLGYVSQTKDDIVSFRYRHARKSGDNRKKGKPETPSTGKDKKKALRKPTKTKTTAKVKIDEDSPFAKLRELQF